MMHSLNFTHQSIYPSIHHTHTVAEFFFINETMIEVDESTFQLTLCTELGGAVLSQDITIQLMDTPSTTAQR